MFVVAEARALAHRRYKSRIVGSEGADQMVENSDVRGVL